jgi:hypothetical protein
MPAAGVPILDAFGQAIVVPSAPPKRPRPVRPPPIYAFDSTGTAVLVQGGQLITAEDGSQSVLAADGTPMGPPAPPPPKPPRTRPPPAVQVRALRQRCRCSSLICSCDDFKANPALLFSLSIQIVTGSPSSLPSDAACSRCRRQRLAGQQRPARPPALPPPAAQAHPPTA